MAYIETDLAQKKRKREGLTYLSGGVVSSLFLKLTPNQLKKLIYLDQMNIYLFKPVELKTWCMHVRKYARYGETSHHREVKTSPMWRKFSSTPENTLILKDSVKIDPFRPKTVKTRYVRAST